MNAPAGLGGQVIKCTRAPKLFTMSLHQLRASIRDSRGKRRAGVWGVMMSPGPMEPVKGTWDWMMESAVERSTSSAGRVFLRGRVLSASAGHVCLYIKTYVTSADDDQWLLREDGGRWTEKNGDRSPTLILASDKWKDKPTADVSFSLRSSFSQTQALCWKLSKRSSLIWCLGLSFRPLRYSTA